jgi:hypothetical protein
MIPPTQSRERLPFPANFGLRVPPLRSARKEKVNDHARCRGVVHNGIVSMFAISTTAGITAPMVRPVPKQFGVDAR